MAKFYYEHPDLIREGIIFRGNRAKPEPAKPVPAPTKEPEPAPAITGICQQCGGPLRTARQKCYCSDDCRCAAELEKKKQRRRAALSGRTCTCAYCGKEYPAPIRISKYCSNECYRAKNEEQAKLKSLTKIKTRKCAACGKEFTTFYYNKLTCSSECAHEWRRMYNRRRSAKQEV